MDMTLMVREFLMDLLADPSLNPSGQVPDGIDLADDRAIEEALEAAAGWEEEPEPTRLSHSPAAVPGDGITGLADTLISRCAPSEDLRALVRQAARDYERLHR